MIVQFVLQSKYSPFLSFLLQILGSLLLLLLYLFCGYLPRYNHSSTYIPSTCTAGRLTRRLFYQSKIREAETNVWYGHPCQLQHFKWK